MGQAESSNDVPPGTSLLPISGVTKRVGKGKSSIYAAMAAGVFPLSLKINGRNYWRSDHIDDHVRHLVQVAAVDPEASEPGLCDRPPPADGCFAGGEVSAALTATRRA